MKISYAALLLIFVFFAGCSKDETTGPEANKMGTLVVKMIDAPGNYDQVNIVVDSVQAHISSSDSVSGWVTLNRVGATYDLLRLVNGVDTVIGRSQVPAGEYSQVRLFIGEGSNIVEDGVTHPLKIPSGSQSGLKLNVHAEIQADIVYTVILDFDVSHSIVETGNGNYTLKPVIRVITEGITGSIAGLIMPAIPQSQVFGYTAGDTVSTFTDMSGSFKLIYLQPATYSVKIIPADTLYQDTTLTGIEVLADHTTLLDTVYLRLK